MIKGALKFLNLRPLNTPNDREALVFSCCPLPSGDTTHQGFYATTRRIFWYAIFKTM